jgi:hypothetical protein
MGVGFGTRPLKVSELESWLGQVLVPVEPHERFVTRLRAKMVELRGARPTRGWVTLLAGVGLVLAAVICWGRRDWRWRLRRSSGSSSIGGGTAGQAEDADEGFFPSLQGRSASLEVVEGLVLPCLLRIETTTAPGWNRRAGAPCLYLLEPNPISTPQ